jgi:hypothetical protein
MSSITTTEAIATFAIFIRRFTDRSGGDETIRYLLEAISSDMWTDGQPNDPAQWDDWLEAFAEVRDGSKFNTSQETNVSPLDNITQEQAFAAMVLFAEEFCGEFGQTFSTRKLLAKLESVLERAPGGDAVWRRWLDAIETVKRRDGVK